MRREEQYGDLWVSRCESNRRKSERDLKAIYGRQAIEQCEYAIVQHGCHVGKDKEECKGGDDQQLFQDRFQRRGAHVNICLQH
jgi:hypothetical protein